jgi:NAD+ kinase
MSRPFKSIAFIASLTPEARTACRELEERYGNADPAEADVIVALGGDGLMLQTLHKFMTSGKPIYGMHRGTVGFLMNDFTADDLIERLSAAQLTVIHPLLMRARDTEGATHERYAINEVSLYRQSAQAANLRVSIDGEQRLPELVSDGILVATPAIAWTTAFCASSSATNPGPIS